MTNYINTTKATNLDAQSVGRSSSSPFVDVFMSRAPTTNDINYPIQKKWLETTNNTFWELKNFVSSAGAVTANWVKIASGAFTAESLTGNTGGAVFPDSANNINVVGDGTYLTVAGNPGTHTLTISPTSAITTLYTEDTGTATPSGGNLNVFGSNEINTSGSGNTITISLETAIPAFYAAVAAPFPTNVTGDSTNYQIIFTDEFYDLTNNYNTTTGFFTAPFNGIYMFTAAVNMENLDAAMTRGYATIDFGGAADFVIYDLNMGGSRSSANVYGGSGSVVVRLLANDTAAVTVRIDNSTKTAGINTNCRFSGSLIRRL